jgi:hypothetical protein
MCDPLRNLSAGEDAEALTLAVLQALLGYVSEACWLPSGDSATGERTWE